MLISQSGAGSSNLEGVETELKLDRIVLGDCLEVLEELPAGFADMAYLDPPFNTGREKTGMKASYADRWEDIAE